MGAFLFNIAVRSHREIGIFMGHTTDYKMAVESIQIEHASVENAVKGDSIGVKVGDKARRNDKVVKLVD